MTFVFGYANFPRMQVAPNFEPFGTYAFRGYRNVFYRWAQAFGRNLLFFKLALVLRKLALKGISMVDADPFGIRCRFYPHENLGDRFVLFMPRYYEDEEREFLADYLKPGHVFVDIGANTGFYSLFAASLLGTAGRILAFEPNPRMVERFSLNLAFNGLTERVEVFPIALADREGELELYFDPRNLGAGTIVRREDAPSVRVKCEPLLQVLENRGVNRIDVLKIDIEGGEPFVLNPFFASAPRSLLPKLLIIESDENITDLRTLGYRRVKRTHSHNTLYLLEES